ncbi:hypothetical protein QBC36DRAFT_379276 [Triangularia setosa]|uniref:Uncharacterized protein n=1 Tax=Triangularia setosa TaxID=2587417 RepID=A0AAN6W7D2_9PEZI|nr:hypothetical protein QBC36DRAFT_379276 [Podospora setosa]
MPPRARGRARAAPQDPLDFDHFLKCQDDNEKNSNPPKTHEHTAYDDIRNKKRGSLGDHWTHCMLPCLQGIKWGPNSVHNLKHVEAAKVYARDPVLGKRLGYLAGLLAKSMKETKGSPNTEHIIGRNAKINETWKTNPGIHIGRFWGCATLFDHVLREKRVEKKKGSARDVWSNILKGYFQNRKEPSTVKALEKPVNQMDSESDESDNEDRTIIIDDDLEIPKDANRGANGGDGKRNHNDQEDNQEDNRDDLGAAQLDGAGDTPQADDNDELRAPKGSGGGGGTERRTRKRRRVTWTDGWS